MNQKQLVSSILFVFFIQHSLFSQIVKIRDRNSDEVQRIESKNSFSENTLVGFDPMWLLRGTAMLNVEHTIGDAYSARIHIGASFSDLADNLLFRGPISSNYSIKSYTPKLSFGLEGRYYGDDNDSFDSWYFGLGFTRRQYSYNATVPTYSFNAPLELVNPTASSIDIYMRSGNMYNLVQWEKSSIIIDYGFSLGFTTSEYNLPGIAGNFSSGDLKYWFLPHLGINYAF
jgi:hypothetical protein